MALLFFHLWAATLYWRSTDLPGNGFRQTQTAITALFIQRDHNFSLAYPTPVLGKPWSIPYEFPLYQWTVAGLSSATGQPLIAAGRAVSLACFYLALPAVWLLLGRIGLGPTRRLLVLGMVLSCPLYIFYARAFLIETMALMFSLWFLEAFLAAVERRSPTWLVAANIFGLGAGLVKVTTFLLYLAPAAAWSLAWLWRDGRKGGPRTAGRTLGWIAAACAVPFAASYAWIRYTDAVRLRNPSSANLSSSGLSDYLFGNASTRFSPEIWGQHWTILRTNLMPVLLLVALAVMVLLSGRRWWGWIAGCLLLFLGIQALFPVLYAWHGYYYVANGVLLMIAGGLALGGLLDSGGHPRWTAWLLIVGVYAVQVGAYFTYLHEEQVHRLNGGSGLTDALRGLTNPKDVLIVAGEDWASMTPFYAERRALMIRRSMENDGNYLDAAFRNLQGERIGALVLTGAQRSNQALRDRAEAAFGIDPAPVLAWHDSLVYLRKGERAAAMKTMAQRHFDDVDAADLPSLVKREVAIEELSARQREDFKAMSPTPVKIYSEFGLSSIEESGHWFLSAHPVTRLWFAVAAGKRTVTAEFLIGDAAYQNILPRDATDGVDFAVYELKSDGKRVALFSRRLEPAQNLGDRGLQQLNVTAEIAPGSMLLLETLPGKTYTRDWALWGKVTIK